MEILATGIGAFQQLSSVGSLKWYEYMNYVCLAKTTISDICKVWHLINHQWVQNLEVPIVYAMVSGTLQILFFLGDDNLLQGEKSCKIPQFCKNAQGPACEKI